ncbi:BatD family protein [Thiogranum longum]|uniref:BatD family protein n=1 Tax=Thiogranum longum TaxID=1537524 RepID=UPI001A9F6BE2|nr:BatD family protein [Thiogranum longum]
MQATLDRSTVYDGETVTLMIEATGKDESGEPDLSPLSKDFAVLGTSTSQRIQIINGRRSDSRQWQVELEPKKTGSLDIPALSVGRSKTKPLALKVMEQSAVSAVAGDRPVFMRTEASTGSMDVYVQQQILYVVRLYYRVPLLEGDFQDPQPDDAVVERLGEDRHFKTTIKGKDYQVVERHYAIFPEKSGDLLLPAITFTGRTASISSRRSSPMSSDLLIKRFFGRNPFDDPFFGGMAGDPGKRFRVRSEALTLEVKPRPASYTGKFWLPSQALTLQDSWQDPSPEFHVGEPVTRTVTLKAKGLESSQLPVIDFPSVQGVRVYPEQPVSENLTDGDWIFGVSKQTVAYVPSTAGKITLPAVRIDWWDTAKHQQRSAQLPAREIAVLPAAGGTSTPQSPPASDTTPDTAVHDTGSALPAGIQGWWKQWMGYRNILLAAVAVLVLLVVIVWWRNQRHFTRNHGSAVAGAQGRQQHPRTRSRELRAALKAACEANNPHVAAKALLEWAALEWPEQPPRNLGALAQRLASGSEEVRRLDNILYGDGAEAWQGEALWNALKTGLSPRQKHETKGSEGLAPLYPEVQRAGEHSS